MEYQELLKPCEPIQHLKTMVFIDYESLYWGLFNRFGELPHLPSLLAHMKQRATLCDRIKVFGDFSDPDMKRETGEIRSISSDIVNCEAPFPERKKDFTDIIMLDHIYQCALRKPEVEQYILVTGDGHFQSAAAFLHSCQEKFVGIYCVKGTLSPQLAGTANWVVQISSSCCADSRSEYARDILRTLYHASQNNKKALFKKTVQITMNSCNGGNPRYAARYHYALNCLIHDGYISQEAETSLRGNDITTLKVNWQRVFGEKLLDK